MSEILEKVIRTTNTGDEKPGLLQNEQADKFIDYMFDATVLLNGDCRTHRMQAPVADIDKIAVGQRLVRVATEAVDTGENAGATFSKISLTTTKLRLDWEISTETLEDNLEGREIEDHIARLMANAFGNDLEDIAINGDTASSNGTLKAFDGWYKRALAEAHVVDLGGQTLKWEVFNKMLKAMPRKFMQKRAELAFYTGTNVLQDYLSDFMQAGGDPWAGPRADQARDNAVRTEGRAGFTAGRPFGVELREIPLFDETAAGTYSGTTGQHGHVELTFPKNRVLGIRRQIEVHREFKPKKDAIEYTVFTRAGVNIENADAYVVGKNLKVAA
jgi:hypothetical protein